MQLMHNRSYKQGLNEAPADLDDRELCSLWPEHPVLRERCDRRGMWLIAKLIMPAKRGGNKRTIEIRAVVDGLMYVLITGCQ
jgi:hypothetical protein